MGGLWQAALGLEAVLAYLSRYTHRVAISNTRLVSADAATVAFRWKDYRIKYGGPATRDAARHGRVHPPVPDPRAARRLPPHPPPAASSFRGLSTWAATAQTSHHAAAHVEKPSAEL
jgi:hypothetical protein